MALSHLVSALGTGALSLPLEMLRRAKEAEIAIVEQMLTKGVASPPTSSVGRLFDAVSALIGVRDDARFEGQAAMELEAIAERETTRRYEFAIGESASGPGGDSGAPAPLLIDAAPVVSGIVDDVLAGVDSRIIAGAFHHSLAEMIVTVASKIRSDAGINKIALSGGVFQNALLSTSAIELLQGAGFDVYTQRLVPCNDGGLSLGQAYVVALRGLGQSATVEETEALCA